MSNNNAKSKAGIFSRTAASMGLKSKKTRVEVVERGNVKGLYGIIDGWKAKIPKKRPVNEACNREISALANAKNLEELTKALIAFQESLGNPIEVTVSPNNETTNKIMTSAFLIAKDKIKEYAKNNNVMKNEDIAKLSRMQRTMTLPTNVNNFRNNRAIKNGPQVEELNNNANKNFTVFNTSVIPEQNEPLAIGWGAMGNASNNNNNESNNKSNKSNKINTSLGGGAKVRRKKATTAMKKKKVTTTAMKKKKATTGMKKKKATGMKKKKATGTKKKATGTKKKATGTKKKATKKKATKK